MEVLPPGEPGVPVGIPAVRCPGISVGIAVSGAGVRVCVVVRFVASVRGISIGIVVPVVVVRVRVFIDILVVTAIAIVVLVLAVSWRCVTRLLGLTLNRLVDRLPVRVIAVPVHCLVHVPGEVSGPVVCGSVPVP